MATEVHNGDIIRVTAKMSHGADDIFNVFHLRAYGDTIAEATAETLIANWVDGLYTSLDENFSTGMTFDTISMFNITQDSPMNEVDWPVKTAGLNAAQALPLQVSPLVLFPTSQARSQGRKYLPPITEADSDGAGQLSSDLLAGIADFIAAVLNGPSSGGTEFFPGNWNSDLARFVVWISGKAATYLRTQRRRVRGVGA